MCLASQLAIGNWVFSCSKIDLIERRVLQEILYNRYSELTIAETMCDSRSSMKLRIVSDWQLWQLSK